MGTAVITPTPTRAARRRLLRSMGVLVAGAVLGALAGAFVGVAWHGALDSVPGAEDHDYLARILLGGAPVGASAGVVTAALINWSCVVRASLVRFGQRAERIIVAATAPACAVPAASHGGAATGERGTSVVADE